MKIFAKTNIQQATWSILIGAAAILLACGDDTKTSGGSVEDQEVVAISDKTVSGVSQKGPFVNGSSVSVQELDGETLAQTGLGFEGKIKNDLGEFSVKVKKLESQYALLKANGFYRNEVTGDKSNSPVTLYALTDLSNRDEVNVNLLTHLAYERTLYLATEESLSVAKAKKQAEKEVLGSFGIEVDIDVAEDLSIFGDDDQSAALLAVSILMQGELNEADFSERLANYAADIESDGVWGDLKTATAIADWASNQGLGTGLETIRKNIADWDLSSGVPSFEKYVNRFWWQNYGLGICETKREGDVLTATSEWSTNNGIHFICNDGAWRKATDIEKDTYKWKAGKDGDVKSGDVVEKNCYVYEDRLWRSGNAYDCSLNLRGCTRLRQDTVGLGSDKVWYVCDNHDWRRATDIEKDTATWGAGAFDGEVRAGQINKTLYYIYEASKKVWRKATTLEKDTYDYEKNKPWGAGVYGDTRKGSLTDTVYFFDSLKWCAPNEIETKYGYCTAEKQDSSIIYGEWGQQILYVCYNKQWRQIEKSQACTEFDVGYVYYHDCRSKAYVSGLCGSWGTWEENGHYTTYDGKFLVCSENGWKMPLGDVIYLREKCSVQRENEFVMRKSVQASVRVDTIFYYYVCQDGLWNSVTQAEYSNGFCTLEREGEFVDLNESYYVCQEGAWNPITQLEYSNGMCTPEREGEMAKWSENEIYYICKKNAWHVANELDFDTYGEKCTSTNVGEIVEGAVTNTNKYYCSSDGWVSLMDWNWNLPKEARLNQEITYGTMTDSRDNKEYKTVKIGNQTWMAENLNYADSVMTISLKGRNWCFYNCDLAGRHYTWAAAIDSVKLVTDTDNPRVCGNGKICTLPDTVYGICPPGWHLPNNAEWDSLFMLVGGQSVAGKILKSQTGWYNNGNGTDAFGFAVLPAGVRSHNGDFVLEGERASFWSASESDEWSNYAYNMNLRYDYEGAYLETYYKNDGYFIRCIKDE